MSSAAELWAQHLRILLLQLLHQLPQYRTNCRVLRDSADALGQSATLAKVRTELAWLAEQGLITTEVLQPELTVATLTERGAEVAVGRSIVPGVHRPAPSA